MHLCIKEVSNNILGMEVSKYFESARFTARRSNPIRELCKISSLTKADDTTMSGIMRSNDYPERIKFTSAIGRPVTSVSLLIAGHSA